MDYKVISEYFPGLSEEQLSAFEQLSALYNEWNQKINVISRKDIDNIYINHVLHSLAIARVIDFKPEAKVLDVGTGGGFPGIPLAILFPETDFLLVDSIGKKIKVVKEVAAALGLKNVRAEHIRAEQVKEKFDFVVSRAVTRLDHFLPWVKGKISREQRHQLANGVLYLKGGIFQEELTGRKYQTFPVTEFFPIPFFEEKYVVHIPA